MNERKRIQLVSLYLEVKDTEKLLPCSLLLIQTDIDQIFHMQIGINSSRGEKCFFFFLSFFPFFLIKLDDS